MNWKRLLSRMLMMAFGLSLSLSLIACGGSGEQSSASNATVAGENKVSKNNLEVAEAFLLKSRPNDFSGSGFAEALEGKWINDPLFEEIIAVSAISGLPTYQGKAEDDFSVVQAEIPNDWADYKIETSARVALDSKGEIVLAWLECAQDITGENPIADGLSSAEQVLPASIRTVVPLSSDLLMAGIRLNEVRAANHLPLIGFESMVNFPENNDQPSQNSEVGNPDNMTQAEQEKYNEAQQESALSEEAALSEE